MNGRGAMASPWRDRKGRWYTALVLLFSVPIAWVVAGAWLLNVGLGVRSQAEPVAGWLQTTGRVAGFHTYQPAMAKQPTYTAVIAFHAAGRAVTFTAPGASAPPTVGTPVRVTYNPRNPVDAHDLSIGSAGQGQIYVALGFLVVGIVLISLICWLVFFRRKSARRAVEAFSGESEGRHVRER